MTGFVHIRTVEIAWGDCDPAGIVFHPRYFEWFDAAAAALFAAATGETKPAMMARYGIAGFPAVEVGAVFHAPCRFGDVVRISSRVEEWKRSSFRLLHELRRSDAGGGETLAVTGRSTRVWTVRDPADPGRIRSAPLPAALLAQFDVDRVKTKKPEETTP